MTSQRQLLLFLSLALIGSLLTYYLFPRLDPASRWNFSLDRISAITKAREAATDFGQNTDGTETIPRAYYNRRIEYYLSKQPDSIVAGLLTPVTVITKFVNDKSGDSVSIDLNSNAKVIGYHQLSKTVKGSDGQSASGSSDTISQIDTPEGVAKDRSIAEDAVKRLFGEQFSLLKLSDVSLTKDGRKFTWVHSDEFLKVMVEVTIRDSILRNISLNNAPTPQFQNELFSRVGMPMRILSNSENIIIWPTIVLIIIFYFSGISLNLVPHRLTLSFLLIVFVFLLLINVLSGFADRFRDGIRFDPSSLGYSTQFYISWTLFVFFTFVIATLLYLSFAAGLALAYRAPNRRSIGVEMLLKGKFLTKPVIMNFLVGLLSGGILSAIPYLVVGSRLFHGAELDPLGFEDLFISRYPSLVSFIAARQILIFIVFAFLGPLIDAYIRRRPIAQLLTFISAFLVLLGSGMIYISVPALILTASLEAILLTYLYYKFDLLAVLIAGLTSQAIVNASAMIAQSSSPLPGSGWKVLIGLNVMLIILFLGLSKAREARDDETAVPPGLFTTRSERERLKFEFAVAMRAQQRLLPDAPPTIEGLDIAAICQPSKEVGGDLYDFILLPEGKLGVVVADVSGKGVPASLYMTLTKGLLDSVSEDKTDPGEILREVNRHLYEVCQRRMFVTLFLGIIDPIKKTLDYARAGHNPTILHRESVHNTTFLKPPGMGLGLNSGNIFDNSLRVEKVQLQPKDLLFFYSDGITEAMNGKKEEYGEERLMKIASQVDGLGAEQARDAVIADVKNFLGSEQPQDDQTLVVVRVL